MTNLSGGSNPLGFTGCRYLWEEEQGSISHFIGPIEKQVWPSPGWEGFFRTCSNSEAEARAGRRGGHKRNRKNLMKSKRFGYKYVVGEDIARY